MICSCFAEIPRKLAKSTPPRCRNPMSSLLGGSCSCQGFQIMCRLGKPGNRGVLVHSPPMYREGLGRLQTRWVPWGGGHEGWSHTKEVAQASRVAWTKVAPFALDFMPHSRTSGMLRIPATSDQLTVAENRERGRHRQGLSG